MTERAVSTRPRRHILAGAVTPGRVLTLFCHPARAQPPPPDRQPSGPPPPLTPQTEKATLACPAPPPRPSPAWPPGRPVPKC